MIALRVAAASGSGHQIDGYGRARVPVARRVDAIAADKNVGTAAASDEVVSGAGRQGVAAGIALYDVIT